MDNPKIPQGYIGTYGYNADGGMTLVAVTKIQKGIEFDCAMFGVRCKQECVSGGVRHTSECPYDNYNIKSKTGVTPKGATKNMADKKTTNKPAPANSGNGNNGNFQPTFRKYSDMSDSEKACFRQGAKTSENKVKERLGFVKPKN